MPPRLPDFLLDDYQIAPDGTVVPTRDPMNVANWAAHTEQHRPPPRILPSGEKFMRRRGFRKSSDQSPRDDFINQLKETHRAR